MNEAKFGVKESTYNFLTSVIFIVTHTNERNTCKAFFALRFELCLSVCNRQKVQRKT